MEAIIINFSIVDDNDNFPCESGIEIKSNANEVWAFLSSTQNEKK